MLDTPNQPTALAQAWKLVERADALKKVKIPFTYGQAEKLYREALEISRSCNDPDISVIYNNLGEILQYLKRPDEALAIYREGIQRYPDIDFLWNGLSELLSAQERWEEARDAIERYLTMDQHDSTWESAARIYLHLKDEKNVRRALRQAIKKANFENWDELYEDEELGDYVPPKCKFKKFGARIGFARRWRMDGKSLSSRLDDAWGQYFDADDLMDADPPQYQKATDLYIEALKMLIYDPDPDSDELIADAYANLGEALIELKRPQEALAWYQEGLRRYPESEELWYEIADLHYENAHYPEAQTAIDHCLAHFPNDSDAWELGAHIYALMKNTVKGKDAFLMALQRNPQLRKTASEDPRFAAYLHLIPQKKWWEFWK